MRSQICSWPCCRRCPGAPGCRAAARVQRGPQQHGSSLAVSQGAPQARLARAPAHKKTHDAHAHSQQALAERTSSTALTHSASASSRSAVACPGGASTSRSACRCERGSPCRALPVGRLRTQATCACVGGQGSNTLPKPGLVCPPGGHLRAAADEWTSNEHHKLRLGSWRVQRTPAVPRCSASPVHRMPAAACERRTLQSSGMHASMALSTLRASVCAKPAQGPPRTAAWPPG